ncbi:MAG: tRNA pseudouridine(55) synthase TruB [Clostridia bacterium]|nr:tRNA pseudouridine(55) synthase TruB [Clostridia bacterium]
MNGLVLINKPQDFTSFDVVAVMRRVLGTKKIGHTGTLDPMATGVLPLLVGKATRLCDRLPNGDKTYRATFRLGITTDTLDSTGKILSQAQSNITKEQLMAVLPSFTGDILQVPPMYSAISVNGVRLYDLARQGKTVERTPRPVHIDYITYLEGDEQNQTFTIEVACSKGTYIRSLIDDIGNALEVGATMTALCRTKACGFSLSQCIDLEKAREMTPEELLLPTELALQDVPAVRVTAPQAVRFQNGGSLDVKRLPLSKHATGYFRVYDPADQLLGLGLIEDDQLKIQCHL